MSWADSLIRIADYEVETLQKRMADIVARRTALDLRSASLEAEAEAEALNARRDAEAGWYHVGFLQGWRMRRQALDTQLREIEAEEQGCRDALGRAFEELKKFEQVAEGHKQLAARDLARRQTLAMDEMASRRVASR